MHSIVYVFIGLAIGNVYCRAIEPENSIQQSDDSRYSGGRDWVKISASPPKIVQQTGQQPVELECEVSGSPPPSVHWVRGNKPVESVSAF